ncbi:MAG: hypothetical protein ACP5D2_02560 [Candidatus Nanoarchaeia archaeon]
MDKIRAVMIIEMMGRPPKHLQQSLTSHVEGIDKVDGVKIINNSESKPKKVKESKEEMYTCFSEVEVEADSFLTLIELIFDFMPSSIEVLSPNSLKMDIHDATSLLNTLSGRLHKYDEIAKVLKIKNQQLMQKLQEGQQASKK